MGCASSSQQKVETGAHGDSPSKAPAPAPAPAPTASKDDKPPIVGQVSINDPKISIDKEFNFRPVHSAVRWNKSIQEVEALLTSQEAVDCVDNSNGNRPIHIAAQNGHDDLVELLLRKNCEVNATNAKGNTALHMAIGYDYYNTAKLLIKAGGDLELVNEGGVPAKFGLEGDKSLGIAALANANTADEVTEAFDLCEKDMPSLNRVSFAQAGLKAKKALGGAWTPALQDRLKDINSKLV